MDHEPASERVRVRRARQRGRYDRDTIHAILDEALVAHVGVTTGDGPVVLPMLHARTDHELYLHGAVGNHLLGEGDGAEVCVTVTLLDGLVLARSAFHHSMNYRAVVVRGRARRVTDPDEQVVAYRLLTDRVAPGRYDDCRPPDAGERRRTLVVAVPLAEASAKVRTGGPIDDDADTHLPHWAGVVPLALRRGPPIPADDLPSEIVRPPYL